LASAADHHPVLLAEYIGRLDPATHRLTFESATPTEAGSGSATQGFVPIQSGSFTFATTATDLTQGSADPSWNSGAGCPANHECAIVQVTNSTTREIDSVFVQVDTLSPSSVTVDNSDPLPTGYYLPAGVGDWSYGDQIVGQSSQADWHFALPAGYNPATFSFTFTVQVYGTLLRSTYAQGSGLIPLAGNVNTGDAAWSNVTPPWRDACLFASHTTILQNQATGTVWTDASGNGIAMPFPFTLYDYTFDTDLNPYLYVSSIGTVGLFPGTSQPGPLPDVNTPYTIDAFAANIATGPSGVCFGVDPTSAAPFRRFVLTWKDASYAGHIADLTFSMVLNERSDNIDILFHRWSSVTTDCRQLAGDSGDLSTIGVEGNSVATQVNYNGTTHPLPVHSIACPGSGKFYVLQAQP
jgi:hypothetical protein